MDKLQKTVAERIKAIREKKGITQEQLAKLLGKGTKMSVSKYESGVQSLSLRTIEKIAKALDVQVDVIFKPKPPKKKKP